MNQKEVFDAEALPIHGLFLTKGGGAGFRIPLYQRTYDWKEDNVKRIFEDIGTGLSWRRQEDNSLTFIGTVIFLVEDTDEKDFDNVSMSVVDGQQRLTTITLMASQLFVALRLNFEKIKEGLESEIEEWVKGEVDYLALQLQDLIYGTIKISGGKVIPFPRIVREYQDNRGKSRHTAYYKSVVGKYLHDFSQNIFKEKVVPFEINVDLDSEGADTFLSNLESINGFIDSIISIEDSDIPLPYLKDFKNRGYYTLFKKIDGDPNQFLTKIINNCSELEGLLRLITFTNYLLECVITTVVTTEEEKYAFEIFDSLNTTGQPLTAIQTFKPQVIRYENDRNGYIGSESEHYFNNVESYLDKFSNPEKRQNEARDVVIPFALLFDGTKVSRSLDDQRRYLRNAFSHVQKNADKYVADYVRLMDEIVGYKDRFWSSKNLPGQLTTHPDRKTVLMCLKFLKDMRMTLTIPILTRFYFEAEKQQDMDIFCKAVKALTAFVVIRRGATGTTLNIDSDLRSIMSDGGIKKSQNDPLCLGENFKNSCYDIDTFRKYLQGWLTKKRVEIVDKKSWVSKVKITGLYGPSKYLCKFILLAAQHNSRVDSDNSNFLKKAKRSKQTDFLNLDTWNSSVYSTIEHIAPDRPSGGWDDEIYKEPYLKDSIGNLTILPKKENSSVANKPWKQKKLFYKAFLAKDKDELEIVVKEANNKGINFSKRLLQLLDQGEQLPIFETIINVKKWTPKVIKDRSENIASLAWDEISPWLFNGED